MGRGTNVIQDLLRLAARQAVLASYLASIGWANVDPKMKQPKRADLERPIE